MFCVIPCHGKRQSFCSCTHECTLKNKFFCGKWQDAHGIYLTITGDHIFYHGNVYPSKYDCQIVSELTEGENPFSLLKCSYFDTEDQKYYTDYQGFYISDWSRYLDKRSPEFESITQNSSDLLDRGRSDSEVLSDICCDLGDGKLICDPERGGERYFQSIQIDYGFSLICFNISRAQLFRLPSPMRIVLLVWLMKSAVSSMARDATY